MALGRKDTPRGERFLGPVDRDVDLGSNRLRTGAKRKNLILRGVQKLFDWVNPYPWMSEVEALVHLELEARGVPFSWRFFDGESPTLQLLMPDFTPEFTLREYKAVILIIGGFFGVLPSVIDKNAMATVFLEEDGWTVALLTEQDIRSDVAGALDAVIPGLGTIKGVIRPNPYGVPDFMSRRRAQLAGQGLLKARFKLDVDKQRGQGGPSVDSGRKRIRRKRGPDSPRRAASRRAS